MELEHVEDYIQVKACLEVLENKEVGYDTGFFSQPRPQQ